LYHTFGRLLQPFDIAMQAFMNAMEEWYQAIMAARTQAGLNHAANNRIFPDAWQAGVELTRGNGAAPRACTPEEYGTAYAALASGFGSCTHTHTYKHIHTQSKQRVHTHRVHSHT
jgi:hypothetical protein